MIRAIAIIPARYASSRFPGKPLVKIGGREMLRRVYENVADSGLFSNVLIATDDDRIMYAAREWGAEAVMTSEHHQSGTDRCAEALERSGSDYEVVVNIQGDEPFISREPLQQVLSLFEEKSTQIGTLIQRIETKEELESPNLVRVVTDKEQYALYFSRAVIPYIRGAEKEDWLQQYAFHKHIGIYAYRPSVLKEIVQLQLSELEKAEMLEQLRWLENGYRIKTAVTDYKMLSVDTPEDLSAAEAFFKDRINS